MARQHEPDNACIDAITDAYLIDFTVPAPGTVWFRPWHWIVAVGTGAEDDPTALVLAPGRRDVTEGHERPGLDWRSARHRPRQTPGSGGIPRTARIVRPFV
jgi:hypothetical protein